MAEVIVKQPTVDAVPVVRGKWLFDGFCGEWTCSNCKSQIALSDDRNAHPNFCLNCGADMRGEKMIDEKLLIEKMWDKYNSFYNDALRFEKEETQMANRVLSDTQRLIEEQPKVNDWIPCSERLPDEDGSYLTTTEYGAVRVNHFYWRSKTWGYHSNKTIAWMPMPVPYDMQKKVKE